MFKRKQDLSRYKRITKYVICNSSEVSEEEFKKYLIEAGCIFKDDTLYTPFSLNMINESEKYAIGTDVPYVSYGNEYCYIFEKYINIYRYRLKENRYRLKEDRYKYVDNKGNKINQNAFGFTIDNKEYKFNNLIRIRDTAPKGMKTISFIKKDKLGDYQDEEYSFVIKEEFEKEYIKRNSELFDNNCLEIFQMYSFNYVKIKDYEELLEELKQEHKPYVIKGTKEPPYYIIRGKTFKASKDENYYQFVCRVFFNNVVQDWMLEELGE